MPLQTAVVFTKRTNFKVKCRLSVLKKFNQLFFCLHLLICGGFFKVKQACFYLYSVVRKRCRGDSDAIDTAQYVPQINLFSEIIVLLIMLYFKKKTITVFSIFSILVFNSVNFVTLQRSVM